MSVNAYLSPSVPQTNDHLSPNGTRWTMHRHVSAESTNDLCRRLAPWSAVRADVQTRGRGRFGRSFVSGQGGLWISAVLPTPGARENWAGFSLRVGASLVEFVKSLGLPGARLRWPNDLMLGRLKLAGLLIEQPAGESLIVGLGLNVSNEPWAELPELRETATSLAEWINPPDIDQLARGVLDTLTSAHGKMLAGGMAAAIEELNRGWCEPMRIEISLSSGASVTGAFLGLDPQGHLRLSADDGSPFVVQHPLVERLREIPLPSGSNFWTNPPRTPTNTRA